MKAVKAVRIAVIVPKAFVRLGSFMSSFSFG
jgi:hypothetical protein